jgi:hypothetical protein
MKLLIYSDFCKKMAKKDEGDSSDESPTQIPHNSDDEGPFMHHPFKVRDAGPIMMNIKVRHPNMAGVRLSVFGHELSFVGQVSV